MLVDSTVLIDFLRGEEKALKVINSEFKPLYTTEINVFELITGVYARKENIKEHLIRLFSMLSGITILSLDRKASLKAGEIAGNLRKEGKMIEGTDSLIAGIALVNGVNEIITANKKHFERIKELKIIDY